MSGLSLSSGIRFRASSARDIGQANMGTVDSAAFSPGRTQSRQTAGQALSPADPVGLTFWVGVGSIVALALLRYSLPK